MDYVVYGTGYGATLMLLGYAIRTWGPGWRFRDGEEAAYDRREFRSARSSWRRFATGLGAAIATGGAVLVLLTFVLMMVNPGDGIGSTLALSVSGLLLVGVAVWAWLFFDRFGAWGVVATPDALSSYEPAQYDSRAAATAPVVAEAEDAGEEELPEEALADEEELEVDEVDDDAEFAARYSKFELHHPEGEEPAGEDDAVPAVADEDRFEAQYSKFESHHPEGERAPEGVPDAEIEEIEEYVETLTPEEVSEDIVDNADEEPVGDDDDSPVETYEDLVGDDASEDPVEDVIAEDPLEVLPEAHEQVAPDPEPEPVTDDEARETPGSREDALRRLRERQAQRARERDADDA